jgi:FHA domain
LLRFYKFILYQSREITMSKSCPVCKYEHNPDGAEYCDACGADLMSIGNVTPASLVSETAPTLKINSTAKAEIPNPTTPIIPPPPIPAIPSPPIIPTPAASAIPSPPTNTPIINQSPVATTAKLISKLPNAPIPEFPIDNSATVGIWAAGCPVDIDLGDFLGSETISLNHAEITYKNGQWTISDMSTNGTCIKPAGQSKFNARITNPTPLNSGDEIAFAKIIFIFQFP